MSLQHASCHPPPPTALRPQCTKFHGSQLVCLAAEDLQFKFLLHIFLIITENKFRGNKYAIIYQKRDLSRAPSHHCWSRKLTSNLLGWELRWKKRQKSRLWPITASWRKPTVLSVQTFQHWISTESVQNGRRGHPKTNPGVRGPILGSWNQSN